MYTSYVASILLSMCMDYISLAWPYSIPHVSALLQAVITQHQKGVWQCKYVKLNIVVSANV